MASNPVGFAGLLLSSLGIKVDKELISNIVEELPTIIKQIVDTVNESAAKIDSIEKTVVENNILLNKLFEEYETND